MNAPLSATGQSTFTSAVPVLPTTDMAQAIIFYEQLGFSVLHQQANYALLKRDAAELHVWLAPSVPSVKIPRVGSWCAGLRHSRRNRTPKGCLIEKLR